MFWFCTDFLIKSILSTDISLDYHTFLPFFSSQVPKYKLIFSLSKLLCTLSEHVVVFLYCEDLNLFPLGSVRAG